MFLAVLMGSNTLLAGKNPDKEINKIKQPSEETPPLPVEVQQEAKTSLIDYSTNVAKKKKKQKILKEIISSQYDLISGNEGGDFLRREYVKQNVISEAEKAFVEIMSDEGVSSYMASKTDTQKAEEELALLNMIIVEECKLFISNFRIMQKHHLNNYLIFDYLISNLLSIEKLTKQ